MSLPINNQLVPRASSYLSAAIGASSSARMSVNKQVLLLLQLSPCGGHRRTSALFTYYLFIDFCCHPCLIRNSDKRRYSLTQPPRCGGCGSGVNHQVAFLNSFLSFLVVSTNLKNVSILSTANAPAAEKTGQRT